MSDDTEQWTIDQVAEYLEYSGPNARGSARRTMSRLGVKATHRPGPTGRVQAYYPAAEVRAAQAARPGKGARTDLEGGAA